MDFVTFFFGALFGCIVTVCAMAIVRYARD